MATSVPPILHDGPDVGVRNITGSRQDRLGAAQ
jgi:hypothetical protein